MGLRIARSFATRRISDGETGTVMVMPIWQHEQAMKLSLHAIGVTDASSPANHLGSLNWYGLFVPWRVINSYNTGDSVRSSIVPTNVQEWDERLEKLLLDNLGTAQDYQGVEEGSIKEASEASPKADGAAYLGPTGVSRWLSREIIMTPWGSDGVNATRKWDLFSSEFMLSYGSGVIAIIVRRENFTANTDFAVSMDTPTKLSAYDLMRGGDLGRINDAIQHSNSTLGDYLRTTMFEGDRFVEVDVVSDQVVSCFVKLALTVDTPYSIKR